MGPYMVELRAEAVEASLLSHEVHGGRPNGSLFEGFVHSLVPSVLLRRGGFGQLREDSQFDPPDGEPGEPAEGDAGEGRAVVRADDPGQAVFLEEPGKMMLGGFMAGAEQCPTVEQIPAEAVGDRQRIAVQAVAGLELSLEVGGPDLVRCVHRLHGPARMPRLRQRS